MTYYVHSTDGTNYRVGVWRDGTWFPGSREDAIRECRLLAKVEPGAYVIGIQQR